MSNQQLNQLSLLFSLHNFVQSSTTIIPPLDCRGQLEALDAHGCEVKAVVNKGRAKIEQILSRNGTSSRPIEAAIFSHGPQPEARIQADD